MQFRVIKSLTNVPDAYLNKKYGKVDLGSVKELVKDIQRVYNAFHEVKQDFEIVFPEKQWSYRRKLMIRKLLTQNGIKPDKNLVVQLDAGQLILTSNGLSKPHPANPPIVFGMTTLHYAAKNGYLNVCKLIAENVQEKNPEDCFGVTPLQLAEKNGHSAVVKYFHSLLNDVEEPRKKRRRQDWGEITMEMIDPVVKNI